MAELSERSVKELIAKNRETLIIVAMIVVGLVVAKNFYKKQMDRYFYLKSRIETEREKGGIIDRIVKYNDAIKKFKGTSWDSIDTNPIIDKIYNLGLESGIRIRDIAPRTKKEEDAYILLPFDLSCETTYKDLVKFLRSLEVYPKFLRVSSVDATPGSKKGRDIILFVRMTVEALYII